VGANAARTLDLVGGVLRRRGRVVLLSDMLEDDDARGTIEALARLRARGDEVLVLRPLTRTEEGVASAPPRLYYDPERRDRALAAAPADDPSYAGRVTAYYDDVAARLRERDIEYVALSTAEPVEEALRAWIATRPA
jgi:hypothetical protein